MGCIKVVFFLFLGPKCLSDHLSQFESVCKKSAKSEEESILGLNAEGKEDARYEEKKHKLLLDTLRNEDMIHVEQ